MRRDLYRFADDAALRATLIPIAPRLRYIAASRDGSLWSAHDSGPMLRRIDKSGSVLVELLLPQRASALGSDEEGFAWVLCQSHRDPFGRKLLGVGALLRVAPDGQITDSFATLRARAIGVTPRGQCLVTMNSVRVASPGGELLEIDNRRTIANTIAGSGAGRHFLAVANVVRAASGVPTRLPYNANIVALALGPTGLWLATHSIAKRSSGTLYRFTEALDTIARGTLGAPTSIACARGADARGAWVLSQKGAALYRMDESCVLVRKIPLDRVDNIEVHARGIAVGEDGSAWVTLEDRKDACALRIEDRFS